MKLHAYGKLRSFQFHCLTAQVRFLKGHLCKIVWSRFLDDHDRWTNWHLLICTDKNLSPQDIISTYALRWWTEPMFNELKNLFGLINAWQQTRQVLARWTMLLSLAYSLPRLLSLWLGSVKGEKLFSIPWRANRPVTAGWIADAITILFLWFPDSLPVEPKCTKINRTQAALLRPTRPNRLKQPWLQNVNTLFLSLKLCDPGILRPFAAPANYKV